MWTAEEMGIIGATQYIKDHKAEEKNLQLVMESDIGTFKVRGLEVTAVEKVQCVLQKIMRFANSTFQVVLENFVLKLSIELENIFLK